MQNRTDSRTPRFSTPQTTQTFPLHDIAIKWPNAQNMRLSLIISSDFLFVPNILSFSLIILAVKGD